MRKAEIKDKGEANNKCTSKPNPTTTKGYDHADKEQDNIGFKKDNSTHLYPILGKEEVDEEVMFTVEPATYSKSKEIFYI